jgi:hypothetical protein
MSEPMFRVTFFKNLLDGAGHPQDCPQASVEINAPDERVAIKEAQQKFATLEEVRSWNLRADRFVVQQLSRTGVAAPSVSKKSAPKTASRSDTTNAPLRRGCRTRRERLPAYSTNGDRE